MILHVVEEQPQPIPYQSWAEMIPHPREGIRLTWMWGYLLISFIWASRPLTTPCWKGYKPVKIEAVAGAVQEEAA